MSGADCSIVCSGDAEVKSKLKPSQWSGCVSGLSRYYKSTNDLMQM